MVSSRLVQLGEQMTGNYSITTTSLAVPDARSAILQIPVAEKRKFLYHLFLESVADTELRYNYSDTSGTSWRATVSLYAAGGKTVVVVDVTHWKVVVEKGTFKSTSYVAESKSMEKFFGAVSAQVCVADPSAVTVLSPSLPAAVQRIVAENYFDPTPVDIRAGSEVSSPYLSVRIGPDARPVWEADDGDIEQWPLSIYGHASRAPGATDFGEDGSAFPPARYNLRDVKGVLYATASRVVFYFPFGRNGFMYGTKHADGYVRAGHLRYEWICAVSCMDGKNNFSPANMLAAPARITFEYEEPNGTTHHLTALLDRKPPVAAPVADRVRARVLAHRLSHADTTNDFHTVLERPFRPKAEGSALMVWEAPGAVPTGTEPR